MPPGVAAAGPTILVVFHPDRSPLVGEALPPITMAGHAVIPVQQAPHIRLRRVRGHHGRGKPQVGIGGRLGILGEGGGRDQPDEEEGGDNEDCRRGELRPRSTRLSALMRVRIEGGRIARAGAAHGVIFLGADVK
jgi:hypothetical protein